MKSLIVEAHRRSLWQVLGIYLMGSWIVLQVVDQLHQTTGMPDWVPTLALVLLLIGLPMVLATAFVQEGMPGRDNAAPVAGAAPTAAAATTAPPAAAPTAAAPARPAATGKSWLEGSVFTWRNAIAGGIAALALFGAATAAWMVMRSAGVGTAATLVARGVIDDGERVLLADFSGDSALSVAATAALRVQLAESGVVSVAEPALVANVLQRMDAEPGPVDLQRALEVAEREGFRAVVGGSVVGAGGGYIVTARVIETATGAELVNVGQSISDPSEFLDGIDRLGRKLRERLGESLGSIRETVPLERATTASIEALRKYTRAGQAFDARDLDQAIALLDEAIALDSSFGMAWRKLAVADEDRRIEAATRAYELRDRLTERERYHTIGIYHGFVTQNSDEAITAYRALIDAYPDDATALNNLAVNYLESGQLDLAAEMFARAVRADPYTAHYYANLFDVLYSAGRPDSARAVLHTFAEQFPDHPNVAWGRFWFAYADADPAAAETELDALLRSEILSLRRQANRAVHALRLREGKIRLARQHWRQAEEDPSALDEANWSSRVDLRIRQDTVVAKERLLAAITASPDSIVDDVAGRLSSFFYQVGDVELGDRYHARHLVVDSLQVANRPGRMRPLFELGHAYDRQMALGEYETALETMEELEVVATRALPDVDPATWADQFVPVLEATGQLDVVIARYEAWIGRRQLVGRPGADAWGLPRAYERLAQLYDAKGDAENAAVNYARFVELWEEADPELQPRVTAARERLNEIVRARG